MNAEIKNGIIERIKHHVTLVDNTNGMSLFGQAAMPKPSGDDAVDVLADHFASGMLKTIDENGFTHAGGICVDESENGKALHATVYLGGL